METPSYSLLHELTLNCLLQFVSWCIYLKFISMYRSVNGYIMYLVLYIYSNHRKKNNSFFALIHSKKLAKPAISVWLLLNVNIFSVFTLFLCLLNFIIIHFNVAICCDIGRKQCIVSFVYMTAKQCLNVVYAPILIILILPILWSIGSDTCELSRSTTLELLSIRFIT